MWALKVKPLNPENTQTKVLTFIHQSGQCVSNIFEETPKIIPFDNVDFGFLSAPDFAWPSNPPHPGCLVTSPVWLTALLLDFLTIPTIINYTEQEMKVCNPHGLPSQERTVFLFYAFVMQIQYGFGISICIDCKHAISTTTRQT